MTQRVSWGDRDAVRIIGHRGFPSRARENTLESFRMALDAGADGVELDVWITADDVPVVHHDPVAPTETGDIDFRTASWLEVSRARFRSSAGIYVVSRLSDVLSAVGGCLLNVEIKPPLPERRQATVDAVLGVIEPAALGDTVLVSSFDAEVLRLAGGAGTGVGLAYLYRGRDEESLRPSGMRALHPRHDLVDADLMQRAAAADLAVNAWTVNDPERAGSLAELGVSGIITDHPDRVAGALR